MKDVPTILEKILEKKRLRVDASKVRCSPESLRRQVLDRQPDKGRRFESALKGNKPNIIAEIKRASPSKGVIRGDVNLPEIVKAYARGGAAAISVLTEEDFFGGSLMDLKTVRALTRLPLLRKDFVFDEYQIYESKAAGADAVLLIAAMLNDADLSMLYRLAAEIDIDVLVEVHTEDELKRAVKLDPRILGINNRDLNTFEVSLETSVRLATVAPERSLLVAESGIEAPADLEYLSKAGFNGFLIGESLMKSDSPQTLLAELIDGKSE